MTIEIGSPGSPAVRGDLEGVISGVDLPQTQPFDEHNLKLLENVHPENWTNPVPDGRYNMVVVGAGTAGLVTASIVAGLGGRVALVEKTLMGGDCLNVGCVPSKTLLRSARAVADVRDAGGFGVRGPGHEGHATVDFGAVMERVRRVRAGISPHDSAARYRDLGVDVFMGAGRFMSEHAIEVDGQQLEFARACIATGARAAALPIPGLAEAGFLTNESIFSLTELPPRLAVIGAGPVGCELAQCFARFGSWVVLLEAAGGILGKEDRDAAAIVERALVRDGIDVRCGVEIVAIERDGAERIVLLANGDQLHVDEILVAAGRRPNVEELGLEAAGVEHDTQGVWVNDFQQTTSRGVYAAGDVCSPLKFTHAADFQARIVVQNALLFGRRRASRLTMPWCTYTDPEIAHVGLAADEAEERGVQIDTYTIEMRDVDRAVIEGDDEGFLKIHVKKGTDRILGATLVGRNAGDMISEVTVAMAAGAGLRVIGRAIHPYPTTADAIRKAADAWTKTRLTPLVAKILQVILRARR